MAESTAGPVAVVCIGMAGSGKTTFMQRINSHLYSKRQPPYVVNLDPAVYSVPFESNIDIRDSINYKEVMKQYNLGPNGGILTSLNLFATKIDQIMSILEKRVPPDPTTAAAEGTKPIKHALVDTPGQIEVFVWSASGSILLETLASSYPTVIAYVIDTPRTSSTSTFMSNMLYACSILYKTKLPMILVFNKTDVKDAEFAKEWMTDFEAFQAALAQEEQTGRFGGEGTAGGGSGYMGSFLNSMSLMLEEFYRHLNVVGVSSMTGDGVEEFFEAVEEKRKEFERDYKPELDRKRKEREQEKETKREVELGKLLRDMNVSGQQQQPGASSEQAGPETVSEAEDSDDSDEEAGVTGVPQGRDDDDDGDDALSQRYRAALGGSGSARGDEDSSLARYLRASNPNR